MVKQLQIYAAMKLKSKVFTIAHQIKSLFSNWSNALKAAWRIAKIFYGIPTDIIFAKKSTGELREAKAIALGSLKTISKGYCRFIERLADGSEKWKSFREVQGDQLGVFL